MRSASRRSGWLLVALAVLLAGCGGAMGGLAPTTDPLTSPTVRQIVTSDGVARRLEEGAVTGTPSIDATAAVAEAGAHVPVAARGMAAQARYAAITLTSDHPVWNFRERPVWLVTYAGVSFVTENCACQGQPRPATTVVALDATSGELVLVYGLDPVS